MIKILPCFAVLACWQIVITTCMYYFFPAVPLNGFLSLIYHLRAMKMNILFSRMIMQLRWGKRKKTRAMFRCYRLAYAHAYV